MLSVVFNVLNPLNDMADELKIAARLHLQFHAAIIA
jgi:hypothetical protein